MSTLEQPTSYERPVHAVLWNIIGRLVRQILQFVVSIALIRLLKPEDFGLVAMVTVFTGFAQSYVDLGVGAALIQRKDLRSEYLHTGFWINMLAGLAICLLMLALSYPIAALYKEPRLQALIAVSSLQFPLSGLSVVHVALLSRAIRFRELNIVEVVSALFSGVASIVLALLGFGVWSLIVGTLSYSFCRVLTSYLFTRWKPRLVFHLQAVREIFRYSAPLVGSDTLNYWVRNADNFLLGRFWGAVELGFYSRAYALMMLPIGQITYSIGAVMFPFLSREQHNPQRLKHILLKSHRLMLLVAFPLMVGLFVLAETFVRAVFGEKWLPIVAMVRVLSIVGAFQVVGSSVGWVSNSTGRTDISLRMSIMSAIVSLACFAIGLPFGGLGVATAYAVGYILVVFPLGWVMAGRLINMSLAEIVHNLAKLLLPAAIMALAVWSVNHIILGHTVPLTRVVWSTLVGAVVYPICVRLLLPQLYAEAYAIIREIGKR